LILLILSRVSRPITQGRPLADWTDCFQSGPAVRLRLAYVNLHLNRSSLGSAGVGLTVFLSVRGPLPFTNENQSGLRGFQRP